jgi:DNA mismatch repair protein MutS2
MDQRAKRVLEYDKIIDRLASLAGSALARQRIKELEPNTYGRTIKDLLAETSEALEVIVKKGPLPLGNFYDIRRALELSKKGGTLTMKQLLEVLYNMNIAGNVISFLKSDLPDIPIIRSLADLLVAPKDLRSEIDRCILSEEEMADNASSELRSLRRNILRQNDAIRNRMSQMISSAENKTYLQDAIITMRQGRYVIPVKQEHRSKFPGMVHDQSASGATLFIEPQIIVNLNNQLRELEIAEQAEVQRILSDLTQYVAEYYSHLINNQELLVQLDVIFAKGKLSYDMDGIECQIVENSVLELIGARHPLIDNKSVVPVSVSIGENYNALIITGPNTGGKTVTLKTTGLLVMMTQTGLHIPCSQGSKVPVFEKVYADIGDEQSIEQSLSTFSSHMKNIVNIVGESNGKTLVLLDELGAGTDPTEGAALGIAVLKDLDQKGATVLATTHYTELKKYAISTKGVENASMEFDIETLSPTYKLILGIPGKSSAFEISEKLGLSSSIIEMARSLLDDNALEFEEVITALEADKKASAAMKEEALVINLAMKKEREELRTTEKKLALQKDKLLQDAKAEARALVAEAKESAAQITRELKELAREESLGHRTQKLQESKSNLKKLENRYRDKLVTQENPNPMSHDEIQVGKRVRVLSLDQIGEVLTLPDDKGELAIQVGRIKVLSRLSDILPIQENKVRKKSSRSGGGLSYVGKSKMCSMSINVQGENLDSAMMDVDKYLDDAYMSGLKKVTVIHGRGEGILRQGLQDMFKKHKHVASFQRGDYNEGGDGVTIVTLTEK